MHSANVTRAPVMPDRGSTGSLLTHLEGSRSGQRYDGAALAQTDPSDGKPLLARYDLTAAAQRITMASLAARRHRGLWRWHELLPVQRWESVATLGEGGTPLLRAARVGSALGMHSLRVKAESLNPLGSFKARGMSVAVSRAVELGAGRLVAPSAGNAGAALAAYAAVTGVPTTVVMPADAPLSTQIAAVSTGARLIRVDGLISDCGRLAHAIAERSGAFDLSTLKEPYRVEGKKTMGYELAEELDWSLPDAIIYPTGGGTGLIGMWKAFAELEALGLIGPARPRMYAVQVEGCAPIVRAWERGQPLADAWRGASTRAAGLRVPSALGDFLILECVRESGGGGVAVPESALASTQRMVGALGAGYIGLETAAAFAGLTALIDAGVIQHDERVVVFDTGAGLTSEPASARLPDAVPADPNSWDPILAALP